MNDLEIKMLSKNQITQEVLLSMKNVLEWAYYNSYMYENFKKNLEENCDYFKVFLAYIWEEVVWICVLKNYDAPGVDFFWKPNINLKRFTVSSKFRWQKIWEKILKKIQNYAFNELKLDTIFWVSNEMWGINFYLKQWALFDKKVVENYMDHNSPEENIMFFKEFLTNKKLRFFNHTSKNWFTFVFTKNKETKDLFNEKWFYDKDYFLK